MRHLSQAFLTSAIFIAHALPALPAAGSPYRVHALVGARVVTAPGRVLPAATVVIRDGIIESVDERLSPPADARVWELYGRTIYPGLIDPYLPLSTVAGEVKDDQPERHTTGAPPSTPKRPGDSHELAWVQPERSVAKVLETEEARLDDLRAIGYTVARVVPTDGIFRGRGAVLSLGSGAVNRRLLDDRAAIVVALERQQGEYPNSLMGVLALVRQTIADARWYGEAHAAFAAAPHGRRRPPFNRALAALAPVVDGREALLFDAGTDPLNLLRINRLATEQGFRYQIVASGAEYRRIVEIAAIGADLIVPLDFPELPTVGDDEAEWSLVHTDRLRDWKLAPANPRWLIDAGHQIAFTTARLEKPLQLRERLQVAVEDGLDRADALAALTTRPARMLGLESVLGTVAPGKTANLVITDGDLFARATKVEAVWIDGDPYLQTPDEAPEDADLGGDWAVRLTPPGGDSVDVILAIEKSGDDGVIEVLSGPTAGERGPLDCVAAGPQGGIFGLPGQLLGYADDATLTAAIDGDGLTGWVDVGDPAPALATAARGERLKDADADERRHPPTPRSPPPPEGGPLSSPRAVVVQNTTIWTQGPAGRLEAADLLVADGLVEAVGRRLTVPPGATVIDGAGMHVTPGLIDAHSHTAITGGVNEGTRTVTAEVRIGDVVDSEDWNLYSQLAGGLTAANLLHGSANPIGGQSQTIKLRWGAAPERLKIADAKPGIKFALGENVKQSNWGDHYTKRYPQSRLGVEQAMRERFLAAADYLKGWDEHRSGRAAATALPPRVDYQLETIGEILRGERLIHCHSYRQDEILMLVRLMQEFGVIIGTFQHVLEGYKVADELAAMGAGASTFSDWWAYKFEVYDAIPWNGSLMWDRGVVVSFNSDSNELARRMNTEASKAVKYGGLPEERALDFVTINPAKQLRVDHRIGSLVPGKDGDFVLWNGHPLDTYSRAEQTWIEGQKYFDRSIDIDRRADRATERSELIKAARQAAKSGGKKAGGGKGTR